MGQWVRILWEMNHTTLQPPDRNLFWHLYMSYFGKLLRHLSNTGLESELVPSIYFASYSVGFWFACADAILTMPLNDLRFSMLLRQPCKLRVLRAQTFSHEMLVAGQLNVFGSVWLQI